ncbi:monocarboxylate transporter 12-like [Haliotis rubra]|uniref:monocarboxylate transporter 12-like n=1 Tax=Haliotis rubra TaxID=36100 RepID=UPI001EE625FB|nr:monocarboxylate transporter 12-like [Haliotis rubra]
MIELTDGVNPKASDTIGKVNTDLVLLACRATSLCTITALVLSCVHRSDKERMTHELVAVSLRTGLMSACFFMNVLNAGYIKCFGILFVEVEKTFNATASVASLLMGVNAAAYSVTALFVLNVVLEKITIRTTTILGVFILATGVLTNSFASNVYVLIFSQGGLAGIGAAMLYGPGLVMVGKYFTRRRALATAICSCGVSTGGMLLPPLVQYLIQEYGLRGAFLVMTGMMLQILTFVSLYRPLTYTCTEAKKKDQDLCSIKSGGSCERNSPVSTVAEVPDEETKCGIRDYLGIDDNLEGAGSRKTSVPEEFEQDMFLPSDTEHGMDTAAHTAVSSCYKALNLSFFKKPLYLLIFGFTAFGFLGVGLLQTFVPPLAKEKGLSEMQAAMLLTIFNGLELVSRLLSGVVSELPFIKRHHLIAFSMVALGVLNQITRYLNGFGLILSYIAAFGILNGIYPALHPAVIIDFVGMEYFSKVLGYVQVFHGAMMAVCYPVMDDLLKEIPSFSSLKTILYRQRHKTIPRLPVTGREIQLEGLWTLAEAGEPFLHRIDDNIIIFTTDKNNERLCTADTVYGDGTFSSAPRLFEQIYTLHAEYQGHMFQFVYCLLSWTSLITSLT